MIYLIFAVNLLLTCIFEGIAILLLFRKKEYFYYSLLCNMLTNPALNLILYFICKALGYDLYYAVVIFLELIVVVVEAYVYRLLCNFKMHKSLLLSVLLNTISYISGVVLIN